MNLQENIVSKISRSRGQLVSIELVPPRGSFDKVVDLASRVSSQAPFIAITWPLDRNPPFSKDSSSMQLLKCLLERVQPAPNILFNLACIGQTETSIKHILDELMELGIRNIFIIRGDCSESNIMNNKGDFERASRLVSFVRSYTGNHFCIGVPGYPDQDLPSSWQCLSEKINGGSDFIITQVLTSAEGFLRFENKCRRLNIKVPIIPGIMPITCKERLHLMSRLRLAPIPNELILMIQNASSDQDTYARCSQFTLDLLSSITCKTKLVHIFTLNDAKTLSLAMIHLFSMKTRH